MRGEDRLTFPASPAGRGSPPHARGRRHGDVALLAPEGDHPRMRGEDCTDVRTLPPACGSPPHARGRLPPRRRRPPGARITPACAGKTCRLSRGYRAAADHPRMRGEDPVRMFEFAALKGSPPHARGRLYEGTLRLGNLGITPACAGKTLPAPISTAGTTDHPRMRGEDCTDVRTLPPACGSPPHARGRQVRRCFRPDASRLTPACAGKTLGGCAGGLPRWDHPRMRGEDTRLLGAKVTQRGSPPHARGRLGEGAGDRPRDGITPACAGKTSCGQWRRTA